jgi:hypothetical protein
MATNDDVENAQAAVIRSLQNLKSAVVQAGDSVSYLNAEVLQIHFHIFSHSKLTHAQLSVLDGKMKKLERAAGVVYHPFRASLFEYAAEFKNGRPDVSETYPDL